MSAAEVLIGKSALNISVPHGPSLGVAGERFSLKSPAGFPIRWLNLFSLLLVSTQGTPRPRGMRK